MKFRKTALLLLAALVAACSASKPKSAPDVVPVMVARATQKDIPLQIRVIGNVQPISSVAIRPLVTGELTRVWFREGEEVRAGQELFTIDPRPYQAALSQAQANLARDQAQLQNANADAARYSELVKKDFVTREDYDSRVATAEAMKATVAADRAAVDNAKLQLDYCDIRSPIGGRTGSLMVHAGNIVHPTDTNPIVVINQIDPVYVQFAVPEGQLGEIRARGGRGLPVNASLQSGGAPIASGHLTFIDNAVDSTTGTIMLKATFPNQSRKLWPGQYVTVAMTLEDRPNAVVVPSQAVQTGQNGEYVYVVKQDSSVEMRPVKVAESVDQQSVITSGVNAGETVVTDGQIRLTPTSHVEVKNAL